MVEIIICVYKCEILVKRPGHNSTLRIDRTYKTIYAEIYRGDGNFELKNCGQYESCMETANIANLRELYRDFVGMEAE